MNAVSDGALAVIAKYKEKELESRAKEKVDRRTAVGKV